MVGLAQNQLNVLIVDAAKNEVLIGATAFISGTTNGVTTDPNGKASLKNIPNGEVELQFSFVGYDTEKMVLVFPRKETTALKVSLKPSQEALDEILIEATRANKSVADLPTRTEVLTEEIDEAASMEPSKIAHLITHSTGIQVQTTSATSNGAVVRIQGLNGRYTQLLKDGFPLYGGLSGSLDVLQIPPLDLRQVEYIKGSASTLYGGGAIGGLVNLLTKTAKKDETLLHINLSHIGARDLNAFVSRKIGKWGFTNLASYHLHNPYDADSDGYTDVPEISKFNFNPKIFFRPNEKTELYLGAGISHENRTGGDMRLIRKQAPSVDHFYYDKQESSRYTVQFRVKRELNSSTELQLKNSYSVFERFMEIRQNSAGNLAQFGGTQSNSFNELNLSKSSSTSNLNIGLNFNHSSFEERRFTSFEARDQNSSTVGVFVNELWDVNSKMALEMGLRTDYVQAKSMRSKNAGETFVLPRFSALWKAHKSLSLRLGGGMGYRIPTLFNEEAEPYAYQAIRPIDYANVEAERSYGANIDFKYRTDFGSPNFLFTLNQMFFYNQIDQPILLTPDGSGFYDFQNSSGILSTNGFESQMKFTFWKFTWFVGYTYTNAFLSNGALNSELILVPKHSIKGDLLFVEENKWRIGWDYEFKSAQLLSSGLRSPSILTTGIVVERTIHSFVLFLNVENFTDVRQSKYLSGGIDSAPYGTPQFTDVWAPLDGFFFNLGLKVKL